MSDDRRRTALAGFGLTSASLIALLAVVAAAPASTEMASAGRVSATAGRVSIPGSSAVSTSTVENWAVPTTLFHTQAALTPLTIVPARGALDRRALKLQLNAYPDPGAAGGAVIVSNQRYRYGTFGTRMRTANCSGQNRAGVVTGTFTYSVDHSDANHNGLPDNDEIDVEFLCAQPEVVYLTIWTDYSETGNAMREISRAINLRTGKVLSDCYLLAYGTPCQPLLSGENNPAVVPPLAGFNSATQFHSYSFDWQPNHVTFYTRDARNRPVVLWNYRGPRSRIPAMTQQFMQSIVYTQHWDPLNGVAHNQPTVATAVYIDSSLMPG